MMDCGIFIVVKLRRKTDMIWYLFEAFRQEDRMMGKKVSLKELSKTKWKYLAMLMAAAIFYFISVTVLPLVYDIYWLSGIALVVYGFVMVYFVRGVSLETDYEKNVLDYKYRLGILRGILNKEVFKLYSEKKIAWLIEDCDRILPGLKRSKSIFRPISVFSKSIIAPLVIFVLGVLAENVSISTSALIAVLIILILMYLLGIFYLVSPIITSFLDRDYKIVEDLRLMLSDIILIDFIDAKMSQ